MKIVLTVVILLTIAFNYAIGGVNTKNECFCIHLNAPISSTEIPCFDQENISSELTFTSNSSLPNKNIGSVTNDEKFDDDETTTKKKYKISSGSLVLNFLANNDTFILTPVGVKKISDWYSHHSFCLYILLQVFRI